VTTTFNGGAGAAFFSNPLDGIGLEFLPAISIETPDNPPGSTGFPFGTNCTPTPTLGCQIQVELDGLSGPINFDVAAVPEPATLAVFGIGLIGLAGARRWRKE